MTRSMIPCSPRAHVDPVNPPDNLHLDPVRQFKRQRRQRLPGTEIELETDRLKFAAPCLFAQNYGRSAHDVFSLREIYPYRLELNRISPCAWEQADRPLLPPRAGIPPRSSLPSFDAVIETSRPCA